MTQITTHAYWLPKAGNAVEEYEDAFSSAKRTGYPPRMAFAIADGATESLLSRNWANVMVKRFVRQWDSPDALDSWLTDTLQAWQYDKREYIKGRERHHKPVQWYEEPGLEAGAFAALLGLVVTHDKNGFTWNATAVGDCCMVHVRAGELLDAFPLSESSAFNSRPFLLSSNPARNGGIVEHFCWAEGDARDGDRVYLMTDALAAWFLRAHEQGGAPWQELDAFRGGDTFTQWVNKKRSAHEMRNDDVTLLRLEFVD